MNKSTQASIQELTELWKILFPDREPPAPDQWAYWILKHGTPIVREGIVELVSKRRKLEGAMDAKYMAKFAATVMKGLSLKEKAATAAPVAPAPTKEVTC
jgi:hypothetical protein